MKFKNEKPMGIKVNNWERRFNSEEEAISHFFKQYGTLLKLGYKRAEGTNITEMDGYSVETNFVLIKPKNPKDKKQSDFLKDIETYNESESENENDLMEYYRRN